MYIVCTPSHKVYRRGCQMPVSCHMGVGIKPESPARVAGVLYSEPSLQSPSFFSKMMFKL